jgi:hypothetical protein
MEQVEQKDRAQKIANDLGLEIVQREVFGKPGVLELQNTSEERFILKTKGIDPGQITLFEESQKLQESREVNFKMPRIIEKDPHGKWFLMTKINGRELNDFYNTDPDLSVNLCAQTANDYQKLVSRFKEIRPIENKLEKGTNWITSVLSPESNNSWTKTIIEANLATKEYSHELLREFQAAIEKEGENFFGEVHGNIIGDHILVDSQSQPWLLDPAVNIRPGKDCYEFLRSLDFMFLKYSDEEEFFRKLPDWINQHLPDIPKERIKLIFSLRTAGILGWDMLHHKVQYPNGDMKKKKGIALKFFLRQYTL